MRAWLVLITDPNATDAHQDRVIDATARALPRGSVAVQLRDKQAAPSTLVARALALRELTASLGASLLVNGARERDVVLARDVGADGVHLPGGASIAGARRVLGQGAYLSAAAHDDEDVRRAVREGADAVLVSPIFATPGKGIPRGVEALRVARALADASAPPRARLDVFALGGVDSQNARSCFEAGAHGIAVIRALLDAPDPAAIARAIGDLRAGLC